MLFLQLREDVGTCVCVRVRACVCVCMCMCMRACVWIHNCMSYITSP